jgi:hypothetical protein
MQTDMGNTGARHFGYEHAPVSVDDAADFVFSEVSFLIEYTSAPSDVDFVQILKATREQTSGKFPSIDETRVFIEW